MVDPILSYVAGIAFLVLLIAPVLYLMFITGDVDEDDEQPGASVVGGAGPVAEATGEDATADEEATADATTDEEAAAEGDDIDDEA